MQIKTNILYNLKTNTLYSFFQEHGILWGTQDIFVIIIQILLPFLLFYFLDSFLKTKDLTFFAFAGGNPPAGDAPSGGGSSGNNDGKDPYKWLKIALGIVVGVTGFYFGVEYFYPGFFGKLINSFKSPAPVTVPEVKAQFLSKSKLLSNPEILSALEQKYLNSVDSVFVRYTEAWNNVILSEKAANDANSTWMKALASGGQEYVVNGVPRSLTFLNEEASRLARDCGMDWVALRRQGDDLDRVTTSLIKSKLPNNLKDIEGISFQHRVNVFNSECVAIRKK